MLDASFFQYLRDDAMKVRFAEITAPGSVYDHARWDGELKRFCSYHHSSRKRGRFHNWNEIRGPGYHVWLSEAMWDSARSAYAIRVEVLHPSNIKGMELFDGIVATTLRCLARSEVTASGVEVV